METDEDAITLIKNTKINNSSIASLFNISDTKYVQNMINPSSQYEYSYILLDTNNASPELSSDTTYGWRFVNTNTLSNGTINSVNNIRNLVGMRIYPVTMNLENNIGEPNKIYYNKVTNINNNFTILIHEFQSQAFIGRNNRRFHFSLFPVLMNRATEPINGYPVIPGLPLNPYYELTTSGKGNGWFWFKKPIIEFSTLTISIANPFDIIKPHANDRILIPIQLIYMADTE